MTKRLKKANQQRLHDTCKTIKRGSCKCNCKKCTDIILMHEQRVMAINSLDNLAHQNRILYTRPTIDFVTAQTNPETIDSELIQSSREDHRDVHLSKSNGVAWWTNMSHRVLMPQLLQEQDVNPVQSECSITTDIHSGSTDIPDSNAVSRNSTPSSEDSNYKSCKDILARLPIRAGSKSDSKIPLSMKIKLKSVAKSVSIPLGQRPRELRGSKIVAKRKLEMMRPVRRTTNHTTDCFSNCIKYSKIPLRSYEEL
ncbi:hypothetical protein PV327_001283 [Microctonus hyperodae]|uniref:Uncharacterized protein n=1 Tax=Microctonus hyperodae TaxID=165561 RepID=A0AA39L365_MICHY|nr:hypothetical protein PV327_001283 [Microctonus hyperodae]